MCVSILRVGISYVLAGAQKVFADRVQRVPHCRVSLFETHTHAHRPRTLRKERHGAYYILALALVFYIILHYTYYLNTRSRAPTREKIVRDRLTNQDRERLIDTHVGNIFIYLDIQYQHARTLAHSRGVRTATTFISCNSARE